MGVAIIGAAAAVAVGLLGFLGSVLASRRAVDRVNPRIANLETKYDEMLTRAVNAEGRAFEAENRAAAAEERAAEAGLREKVCERRIGKLEDQITELRDQVRRLNGGQIP
jgi:chromosome segregation ATPase